MHVTNRSTAEQSDEEVSSLRNLSAAVYPPATATNWAGKAIEWSPRQWSVIIWNYDQSLALAHAGIVLRNARHNENNVKIGGVGGVMTHPQYRRQGYATAVLGRCIEFFQEQGDIDFGLLVCQPNLVSFYGRLGWRRFAGELFVIQRGERTLFTFNVPMTKPVGLQADLAGTIDLLGPPW